MHTQYGRGLVVLKRRTVPVSAHQAKPTDLGDYGVDMLQPSSYVKM